MPRLIPTSNHSRNAPTASQKVTGALRAISDPTVSRRRNE